MTELASEEPDSTATEGNDASSGDTENPRTLTRRSPEGYFLLTIVAFIGIIFFWEGVDHALGQDFLPHDTPKVEALRTAGAFAVAAPFLGLAGIGFFRNWINHRNQRRKALAELRSSTFPQRAAQASIALREATLLVEELKTELEARTTLLEEVKRQVEGTVERAREMEKLSQVDEETTGILNRYFDEALARRLGNLEKGARRREWLLGTFGALVFGVIAILLAHYVFGF